MLRRLITYASLPTILLLTAFVAVPFATAQSGTTDLYFPETGHTVRTPFLQFFNTTGGIARYGYPITDAYVDDQTGLLVQYFQKARLEWHPANPDPYKIQLGLLGDELNKRVPPLLVSQIPSPSDPNCQYFPETGHSVCLKFLEYWRNTGGLDMYGYPITEYIIENDRIVQYFQRARMEWHPEKPDGQRIQLAPLGQIYFDWARLDRERLKGRPDSASPRPVSINARASVQDPVAARGALQTGYLYVSDQLNTPLNGVGVTLVVHYPSGAQSFQLAPTNANGSTSLTFPVGQARPGTIITMEFILTYPDFPELRTRTSYMVWFY